MHMKIPAKSSASCFSKRAFFFVWPPPQIHRVSDSWEASCCFFSSPIFFLPHLKRMTCNLGKAEIPRSPSFLRKIPKAGASACEKGGRWLLSLELLREAKVGGRWWGFLEVSKMAGFFLNAPDSKKKMVALFTYMYILYLWYAYYIIYVLWLTSLFPFNVFFF